MKNVFEIYEKIKNHNYGSLKEFESIKEIYIFIQPNYLDYNKNIWEDCANILAIKSDEELIPYLIPLFEWLQDLNWPGAQTISNRLSLISPNILSNSFMYSLIQSSFYKDTIWKDNLLDLDKKINLSNCFTPTNLEIYNAYVDEIL